MLKPQKFLGVWTVFTKPLTAGMGGHCIRGRTALQTVGLWVGMQCARAVILINFIPCCSTGFRTDFLFTFVEDRVLWYSQQFRDWDVGNGTFPQEVNPSQCTSSENLRAKSILFFSTKELLNVFPAPVLLLLACSAEAEATPVTLFFGHLP